MSWEFTYFPIISIHFAIIYLCFLATQKLRFFCEIHRAVGKLTLVFFFGYLFVSGNYPSIIQFAATTLYYFL